MLQMTEHLGYAKGDSAGQTTGNHRRRHLADHGAYPRAGPVPIEVPRDRQGGFEPQFVPKHSHRVEGFDEAIISLYAKGLTTGEIQAHLAEIYSTEVSRDLINRVTDQVYPVLLIDAIHVKIRDGQVTNRPIYVVVDINCDGERDVLGLWVGTGGEGAKHWMNVLTELKTAEWPTCSSPAATGSRDCRRLSPPCGRRPRCKSAWSTWCAPACGMPGTKHWSAITKALRTVYTAPTVETAEAQFTEFEQTWGRMYPAIIRLWQNAWEQFTPFLAFPPEIREIVYTTNAIESLNARFRQATRRTGPLPQRTGSAEGALPGHSRSTAQPDRHHRTHPWVEGRRRTR